MTAPTNAAMRLGQLIAPMASTLTQTDIAIVIDAETRLPELVACLRAALADLEGCWEHGVRKGYQHKQIKCLPTLRALLARYEGPEEGT